MYLGGETLTLLAFVANIGMIALVTLVLAIVWYWQAPSTQ